MPELPEVHTVVVQLTRDLRGAVIRRVSFYDVPKMLQPAPRAVNKILTNAKVVWIGRCAKLIVLGLERGQVVMIHLKLNGRLLLRKKTDPPDPYTHIVLELKDGREIRFADSRKFGFVKILPDAEAFEAVCKMYGPEPLSVDFSLACFTSIVKASNKKIKALLLDQIKISGIGNIYSDEALFLAGVDPRRRARTLTAAETKKLYQAIHTALKAGIVHHGTSDQWYVDLHGQPGRHQDFLQVYGRDGQQCVRCKTTIVRVKFGSRSGRFCPTCQK